MALTAQKLIQNFLEILLIPGLKFMFAVAFLIFAWGIFQMIWGSDKEGSLTKGKDHMMWGIIGMVIMFGVGGIMGIITDTLGTTSSSGNNNSQQFTGSDNSPAIY